MSLALRAELLPHVVLLAGNPGTLVKWILRLRLLTAWGTGVIHSQLKVAEEPN